MSATELPTTLPINSMHTIAVHDRQSGHVMHVHEEVVLEGAEVSSPEDLEESALASAHACGVDRSRVSALNVTGKGLQAGHRYQVDMKTRSLIDLGELALRSLRRS